MKLIVAGCSASDYSQVKHPYGEVLASQSDKFSDYIHRAAGCGSNYRIMRIITHDIMKGIITPDDLLIVQWTTLERDEVASAFKRDDALAINRSGGKRINFRDDFSKDIDIIRYKIHSSEFHHMEKIESEYLKLKEDWFTHMEFERERFDRYSHMFQTMLVYNNINTIFFKFSGYANSFKPIREFENRIFEYLNPEEEYRQSKDDWGHLNQEGHNYVANELQRFIELRNII